MNIKQINTLKFTHLMGFWGFGVKSSPRSPLFIGLRMEMCKVSWQTWAWLGEQTRNWAVARKAGCLKRRVSEFFCPWVLIDDQSICWKSEQFYNNYFTSTFCYENFFEKRTTTKSGHCGRILWWPHLDRYVTTSIMGKSKVGTRKWGQILQFY